MLRNALFSLLLFTAAASAQYQSAPAGTPPTELGAAVTATLQPQGTKISDGKGAALYEIWFVKALPTGPKNKEESLTLGEVPHGSVVGAIRVSQRIADRRGDQMKPGLYTMRYSFYPVNGAHQGVAPQRDFLVLLGAAADQNPAVKFDFGQLMTAAEKTSGIAHPYVLSFWKQDAEFAAGFAKQGEKDWVLQTKIGDTPIAVILVGEADH